MKISHQVYEAANKMLSSEMKPLLEWIEAERKETLEMLSVAKPDVMQIMQGRAQGLKQVLDVVQVSREILDKKRAQAHV